MNHATNVFRKHLRSKLLFIKQVTKPKQMKKKFSPYLKSCQNLENIEIQKFSLCSLLPKTN